MFSLRRTALALLGSCTLLAGCASPQLHVYTLGIPVHSETKSFQVKPDTTVVQISRVIMPDYLDCQDIITRNGEELRRSSNSRWASRLSLGVTDLITNEVAATQHNALFTDQPLIKAADMQVVIAISQFDVDVSGHAVLNAHWAIAPRDRHKPIIRNIVHLSATGPVKTDADTAALMRNLVMQLATHISSSIPVAP
ncbi:PqiC family protein [Bombella sp. TMW 2.2543]|uniref:PqiC family protein n=1 Tax=Bombella pluederhausensis TaxID=2967336 RepID=A0ABT3WHF4_9PROT|nr:PqiC family protein [Bombella pluederhausensis]MCX5618323.1 PqiC family protein [Bombella pluederhausensis]